MRQVARLNPYAARFLRHDPRYAHLLAGKPDIPAPARTAPATVRAAVERRSVSSGSPYEPVVGFSRAVRVGNAIAVSGTGPLGPDGETVGPGDIAAQMRRCVEIALAAAIPIHTDIQAFDLDDANHVLDLLKDSKINGAAVLNVEQVFSGADPLV